MVQSAVLLPIGRVVRFAKEKDLIAFLIEGDYRLPEWMDVWRVG